MEIKIKGIKLFYTTKKTGDFIGSIYLNKRYDYKEIKLVFDLDKDILILREEIDDSRTEKTARND